jgi:hypothetical protein
MVLSMIINESLVARTFGAYALRPFSLEGDGTLVSVLGVLLIIAAYLVNASGARAPGRGGGGPQSCWRSWPRSSSARWSI